MAPTRRRLTLVGLVAAAVVAVLVCPPPASASGAAPVAVSDLFTGRLNRTLQVPAPGLLANDTDPEGDRLVVRLAYGPPSYGELDLRPDGSFTYTPSASNVGYDSFAYQVSDGTSWSTPAWVTFNLYGNPVGTADHYNLLGARYLWVPASSGVLANDSGQPKLASLLSLRPKNGIVILLTNGAFVYLPRFGFIGTDTFSYWLRDGAHVFTRPVKVQITVAPSNVAPVANPDTFRLNEDDTLEVPGPGLLANDVDADGHALRVELVDWPGQGWLDVREDGSFTYQTDLNQDGDVSFRYRVTDGFTWSEPTTVLLDVVAVNDPPVAEPDAYSVERDTVLEVASPGVLANDADPVEFDGAVVHALITPPSHGTLTLAADGSFVYVPDAGFVGYDFFVYQVGDVGGAGANASVDLDVYEPF